MAALGRLILHQAAQVVDIAFNADIQRQDLAAFGIEEEGIGLADLGRQQEDAARGAHHGVHHVRIGHQHVTGVGIELHHRRLVERQGQALIGAIACGNRKDARGAFVQRAHRGYALGLGVVLRQHGRRDLCQRQRRHSGAAQEDHMGGRATHCGVSCFARLVGAIMP
jgi:hypothetical protein